MLTGDRRRPVRAVPKLRAGAHHISSARRPRLLDPASPVGAAGFGHVWLDGGSTGGTNRIGCVGRGSLRR